MSWTTDTSRTSSERTRAGLAVCMFLLFAVVAALGWRSGPALSVVLFAFAVAGPAVYLAGESYVDGKREEARGRIEAAKARRERR